jgi:hypothetical protein
MDETFAAEEGGEKGLADVRIRWISAVRRRVDVIGDGSTLGQ